MQLHMCELYFTFSTLWGNSASCKPLRCEFKSNKTDAIRSAAGADARAQTDRKEAYG